MRKGVKYVAMIIFSRFPLGPTKKDSMKKFHRIFFI